MLRRTLACPSLPALSLLTLPLALLTVCGIGATAAPNPTLGPALSGTIFGGALPIIGATVKIYAVGNAGTAQQPPTSSPGRSVPPPTPTSSPPASTPAVPPQPAPASNAP